MDVARYKRALLKKEQDLLAYMQRIEAGAREPVESEVHDEIDEVTSAEVRAAAFRENTIEYQTLQQVRAALRRIEDGSFGKCIACGREILPARLDAVPWTPYCIDDQRKHDEQQAE